MPAAAPAIRLAGQGDVPELGRLFDLYRQFYEQRSDVGTATAFVAERLARQESRVLVAQLSGQPGLVGFCQLYPLFCSILARPIYCLSDLYVQPAQRRLGLGRHLLLAAQAQARADGKVRLDLTTAHGNVQAQRLYESLGWVRDEVYRAYTCEVPPV